MAPSTSTRSIRRLKRLNTDLESTVKLLNAVNTKLTNSFELSFDPSVGQKLGQVFNAEVSKQQVSVNLKELKSFKFDPVVLDSSEFADQVDMFSKLGKDLGKDISKQISKTKIKTKDGAGPLSSLFAPAQTAFQGIFQQIGFDIGKVVQRDISSVFGVEVAELTQISKLIKGLENPVKIVFESEGFEKVRQQVRKTVVDPVSRVSNEIADNLVSELKSKEFDLKRFLQNVADSFTLDKLSQDLDDAGNNLRKIFNELKVAATSREVAEELTLPVIREVQKRNLRRTKEEGVRRTVQRRAELGEEVEVGADTKTVIFAIGGLGRAGGIGSRRTAGSVRKAIDDPATTEVRQVNNPNIDPLRQTTKERQAFFTELQELRSQGTLPTLIANLRELGATAKTVGATALPTALQGFNLDSVELAAQALQVLEKNPEVKVKLVGESAGGFSAREAQIILNELGFGDRVTSAGLGTPAIEGQAPVENFTRLLSPNEEVGRALVADNATGILNSAARLGGLNLPTEDEIFDVWEHTASAYLESAEGFVFISDNLEAATDKELAELESELEQIEIKLKQGIEVNVEDIREAYKKIQVQALIQTGELKPVAERLALRAKKSVLTGLSSDSFNEVAGVFNNIVANATDGLDQDLKDFNLSSINARSTQGISELQNIRDDITGKVDKTIVGIDKVIAQNIILQIDSMLQSLEQLTFRGGLQEKAATLRKEVIDNEQLEGQLNLLTNEVEGFVDEVENVVEKTRKTVQAKGQLTLDDIKPSQPSQNLPDEPKAVKADVIETAKVNEELKNTRKLLIQLNSQIENSKNLNQSTVTFNIVESLKRFDFELINVERSLRDVKASADNIQISDVDLEIDLGPTKQEFMDLNRSIGLVNPEIKSTIVRLQDIQTAIRQSIKRVDEFRLPNLTGATSDASQDLREGFDKVAVHTIGFGDTIAETDAGLSSDFLSLRDKLLKIGQDLSNGNKVNEELNEVGKQLSKFSQTIAPEQVALRDRFFNLAKTLQDFQASIKTGPETTLEIDEQFQKAGKSISNFVSKIDDAPSIKDLLRNPIKVIGDEFARIKTFGQPMTDSMAKVGIESVELANKINNIKIDTDFDFDTSGLEKQIIEVASAIQPLQQLNISADVQSIRNNISNFDSSTARLSNIADSFGDAANDTLLGEAQLKELLVNFLKVISTVGTGLERTLPLFKRISRDADALNDLTPLIGALATSLSPFLDSIERTSKLNVVNAQALEILSNATKEAASNLKNIEVSFTAAPSNVQPASEPVPFNPQPKPQSQKELAVDGDVVSDDPPGGSNSSNDFSVRDAALNKINQQINDLVIDRANEVEQKVSEMRKKALDSEVRENLDQVNQAFANVGPDALINALSDDFILRTVAKPLDDGGIDAFKPVREEFTSNETQLARLLPEQKPDGTITKKAAKSQKKVIELVRKRLIEFIQTSDEGFEEFDRFLNQVVDTQLRERNPNSELFGSITNTEIDKVFKPEFSEGIFNNIGDGGIPAEFFISDETLRNSVEPAIKEYRELINELSNDVRKLLSDQQLSMSSALEFDEASIKIKAIMEQLQIFKGIIEDIQNAPLISDKEKARINQGQAGFATQKTQFVEGLLSTGLELSRGNIPTDISQIDAITDISDKILAKAEQERAKIKEGTAKSGEQYVLGFIAGLERNLPRLLEAADGAALESLLALKKALDIKSPSGETEEQVGKPFIQGIIQGIINTSGKLFSTIKDVANQSVNNFKEEIEKNPIQPDVKQPTVGNRVKSFNNNPAEQSGRVIGTGLKSVGKAVKDLNLLEKGSQTAAAGFSKLTAQVFKFGKGVAVSLGKKTGVVALNQTAKAVKGVGSAIRENSPTLVKVAGFFKNALFAGLAVVGVSQLSDAFIELGRSVIETTLRTQRFKTVLRAVTDGTDSTFNFVNQTAKDLKLNLEQSLDGFSQLAAATKGTGLEGQKTREIFRSLAVSSQVLGRTSEQQLGIIRQIGQAINKGKFQSEEINTIAENGLNIRKALRDALNIDGKELTKELEAGRIGVNEIFLAIKSLETASIDSLNDSLKSLPALANEARNLWTETLIEIGNQLQPFIRGFFERSITLFKALIALVKDFGPTALLVVDVLTLLPKIIAKAAIEFTKLAFVRDVIEFFRQLIVETGLLKGLFAGALLVALGTVITTLKSLAIVAIPAVIAAIVGATAASWAFIQTPLGPAFIAIGLAAGVATGNMDKLGIAAKVVAAGVVVLATALKIKAVLAAKAATVAFAGMTIALGPLGAGLIAVGALITGITIFSKELGTALTGVSSKMVEFNSEGKPAERNQIINSSFRDLAKGVALTDEQLKKTVKTLEDEIEHNKELKDINGKIIANIKERQKVAEAFTEQQTKLSNSIDETTKAFERQQKQLQKNKQNDLSVQAELLENNVITAAELSAKEQDIAITTNENLKSLQAQRIADLKDQQTERDRLLTQFPDFPFADALVKKFDGLDNQLIDAESEFLKTSIDLSKDKASRENRIEADAQKKLQEISNKKTQQLELERTQQQIALKEQILLGEKAESEISLSEARNNKKNIAAKLEAEKQNLARIRNLTETSDKDIQKARENQIAQSEGKIAKLKLDSINSEIDLRKKSDDAITDQVNRTANKRQKAINQINLSIQQSEIENKELLEQGLIDREDIEERKLDLTQKRVMAEIELERARLKDLSSVSFSDPTKEKERQQQILDIRSKINDKTIELIDLRLSAEEKAQQKIKKLINERSALSKLELDREVDGIEKQLKLFDKVQRSIDRTASLQEAKSNLTLADLSLQEASIEAEAQAFETRLSRQEKAKGLAKDATREEREAFRLQQQQDEEREAFQIELIKVRKEALLEQQQADADAKGIELERQQIAARRAVFEQKIATLKSQQAVLEAQSSLQNSLLEGDQVKIQQDLLKLQIAKDTLGINKQLLKETAQDFELSKKKSKLDEKSFGKKQRADRINFRSNSNAGLSEDLISTSFDSNEAKLPSFDNIKLPDISIENLLGLGKTLTGKQAETTKALEGQNQLKPKVLIAAMTKALQSDKILNNLLKVVKANENSAEKITRAIGGIPSSPSSAPDNLATVSGL